MWYLAPSGAFRAVQMVVGSSLRDTRSRHQVLVATAATSPCLGVVSGSNDWLTLPETLF